MSPPTTTTTTTDCGDDGPSFWESLAIIMVVSLLCSWMRRMTYRAPLSPSRAQAQREEAERFARAQEEGLDRLFRAQFEDAAMLLGRNQDGEGEAERLARARLEEEADRLVGARVVVVAEEEANERTTMTFRELWEGVRSGEIPMESLAQYTLVER
ncbi:hypothetical protein LQW54_000699 [Pestalotiopsis sp. IQ-011]